MPTKPSLEHRRTPNFFSIFCIERCGNEKVFTKLFSLNSRPLFTQSRKKRVIIIRIGDLWTVVPVRCIFTHSRALRRCRRQKKRNRARCGGMLGNVIRLSLHLKLQFKMILSCCCSLRWLVSLAPFHEP